MNVLETLTKKAIAHPPKWLPKNVHYLTEMGSVAYGVSGQSSDVDVYGVALPPLNIIFPHLNGEILGFGTPGHRFEVYQEHHLKDRDNRKEYDFAVYGIVKYVELLRGNNPNMIDSIYTPERCVLFCTPVGRMLRDERSMFLSKLCWPKFRGYAVAQRHKMLNTKVAIEFMPPHIEVLVGKMTPEQRHGIFRIADVDLHTCLVDIFNEDETKAFVEWWCQRTPRERSQFCNGIDVKQAYHLVRLLLEAEQILIEGDLDITRSREMLKSIRAGEWTIDQINEFFEHKEKQLEGIYGTSKLRAVVDEDRARDLLMRCIEEHYGSVSKSVVVQTDTAKLITELRDVLDRYEGKVNGQ